MVWSYPGDPNATPKDAVRFYIGDVVEQDPQLQDEEISFLLGVETSVLRAAWRAAEALVAKYARSVDKRVDRLDLHTEKRLDHYKELALLLKRRAIAPMPYMGGISVADKATYVCDTDLVNPFFTRLVQDYGPEFTDPRLQSGFFG